LYGEGHETCGLTVGRNGVAIWHRQKKYPFLKMVVPSAIEGWTHVAMVYHNGIPSLFLNGKPVEGQLIKDAANVSGTVHPGLGKAFLRDGASYYNGDMGKPRLFAEALDEERIRQLAQKNPDLPEINEVPLFAESAGSDAPGLLFWQNGHYSLIDNKGKTSILEVAGISEPVTLSGAWDVSFPPNWGAPEHVVLPELVSLHKHEIPGVKYFSGTAAYNKKFTISAETTGEGKRLFLDLGRVAVIAEVHLNGKNLGTLWTRPYRIEITGAVIKGENDLTVKVVNLWPNRLIGDEQLPPEYEFEDPVGDHGASIKKMPRWYLDGGPKPKGERVTFCTWQHFQKNDPLLESGLVGPVTIRSAIHKKIT
ncbi:MAG: glycosylhydrolase-like jelly roll fold domain-containing protein, partial [Bacteroidota bacterium]